MDVACPIEWEPVENRASSSWFVVTVVPLSDRDWAGSARRIMDCASQELSDEALMGDIARGDADAFAAFYDRHAALLYSVAAQVLRDDREAEDVLQEAMVSLWERAAQYDPALGRPLSWAVVLTRNRAIDRLRGLRRRPQSGALPADDSPAIVDGTASAPAQLIMRESAGHLRDALGRLPAEQRRSIEEAFFRGLTHVEIAERDGVPLGTVKARIRRGMLLLRDALEGRL